MTKKRTAPGRPAYAPTDKDRAQVAALAGMGIPDYDIAKLMQVSGPTLRKHFAHELDVGHVQANAKVAQSLFKQATDPLKPNVAAAIFWLKARCGWRDDGALGKKEIAEQHARSADAGTAWEGLLQ